MFSSFSTAKKKLKSPLCILSLLLLTCAILVFSGACTDGVRSGLENVSRLLIPSLFPFMVLSSFFIRSGIYKQIGRLLSPVTGFLFCLPGEACAGIILSFVGGYPVGARCVRLLYEEKSITAKQAEQMMLFCICSGPAFLITGVGTLLTGSPTAGIILYASQLVSGLLLGIVSGRIYRSEYPLPEKSLQKHTEPSTGLIDSFILSCADGAGAILQLTAMVVFFSMLLSLSRQTGVSEALCRLLEFTGLEHPQAEAAFPIILEVTAASKTICSNGCSLSVMAFASGFGGLCVLLQIFSMLKGVPVSRLRITAFRLINAALSAFIVYVYCLISRRPSPVFMLFGNMSAELTSTSAAGAIALVVMSAVFVLSLKNNRKYGRRTLYKS